MSNGWKRQKTGMTLTLNFLWKWLEFSLAKFSGGLTQFCDILLEIRHFLLHFFAASDRSVVESKFHVIIRVNFNCDTSKHRFCLQYETIPINNSSARSNVWHCSSNWNNSQNDAVFSNNKNACNRLRDPTRAIWWIPLQSRSFYCYCTFSNPISPFRSHFTPNLLSSVLCQVQDSR